MTGVDIVGFLVILAVFSWQVTLALSRDTGDLWPRLAARLFFTSLFLWATAGVFEVLVLSYGSDFASEVGRFPQVARAALFILGAASFAGVSFALIYSTYLARERSRAARP